MTLTFKGTDRDGAHYDGTSALRGDAVAFYRWYLGWKSLDVWDETGAVIAGIRQRPDGERGGWWATHKSDSPGGVVDPQPESVAHQRALRAWRQAKEDMRVGRPSWWPSSKWKARKESAEAHVAKCWDEVERTSRALSEALTDAARDAVTR